MANNSSAEKKNRQRVKRHARNRLVIGKMRTAIKRARAAIEENEGDAASHVKSAAQLIDKAVSKGVVKRKTASRTVSRLSRASRKSSE